MQCVVSMVPRAVAHRGQFSMILASSSMAHLPKNHSKMHENGLWRKIFFACGALIGAPPRPPDPPSRHHDACMVARGCHRPRDRSIGGCYDRRRATSRGGRAGACALATTGAGRVRRVLYSCVASTCLRPCCLRRVSRSG